VDDDGLLQIDWPTPAAGSHPLAVDLILATATQAQSKRPTIADIANAWATQAHGYERYFIENIRAGIHTTKDEGSRPGTWCMSDAASASVWLFLAGCF